MTISLETFMFSVFVCCYPLFIFMQIRNPHDTSLLIWSIFAAVYSTVLYPYASKIAMRS